MPVMTNKQLIKELKSLKRELKLLKDETASNKKWFSAVTAKLIKKGLIGAIDNKKREGEKNG